MNYFPLWMVWLLIFTNLGQTLCIIYLIDRVLGLS